MKSTRRKVPLAYCTTREAAERLGVSLRTAQLWVENGLLEAWKTEGGHRRISVASLERLLATPRAKAAPQTDSGPQAFQVLAVDDDPTLLKMLEVFFRGLPFPVALRTAANGVEGLIALGQQKPDLLLSDLRMQGMDGFEMIRKLTRLPHLAGLEIIVITALDEAEIAAGGGLPGVHHVLHKPLSLPALERLVIEIHQRSEALLA